MLILYILLATLLVLILGFLLTPITLYIDTEEGRCEIYQLPVFRFFVVFRDSEVVPRMRFIGIDISLSSAKKSQQTEKEKKKKGKARIRKSLAAWSFLVEKILKSFKVRRVTLDVDTDNVVLNAQLTPILLLSSGEVVRMSSNFQGRAYLHLEMSNLPARMLWIFLQFLTKK